MRWEKTKLDEIKNDEKYSLIGGPFGSKLTSKDYVSVEGVPVIRGINLPFEKKFSHDDLVFVSEEKAVELRSNLAYPNDIIFTQRGTLGQVGLIPIGYYEKYVVSQSQMKLTVNPEKAIPEFVYYFFSSEEGRRSIEAKSITSGVPHINLGILKSTEIPLPPLPTQRRIASILSAYDDLIENNLKRIKLLEEAAQNIYREWFVHFRFPGHERVRRGADGLPEGWRRVPLGEAMQLNYGKSLTQESRNSNGPYPVYGSSGIVGYHDEYLVEGIGIILGRKGNVGTTFLSFKNFYPIDTVYYVVSDLSVWYAYLLLSNESFVSSDAAVPGLNRNYAYSKMTTVPTNSILKEFDLLAEPIFQQINLLNESNGRLKEARDILLPRLMNQTIEV